ncbi:MAG: hypothetical protein ACNI3A_00875 [Desulfovibrio sp.]|uniref:hypothetical protein n=1 Tax=Desulfovibrio sp. 7SRBS1 TaxID=3378064 RepID=UPI003B42677D
MRKRLRFFSLLLLAVGFFVSSPGVGHAAPTSDAIRSSDIVQTAEDKPAVAAVPSSAGEQPSESDPAAAKEDEPAAPPATSQPPQLSQNAGDTPPEQNSEQNSVREKAAPEKTGVAVQLIHNGSDPVGQALAFALKERLVRSPLFHLGSNGEHKIVLRLKTRPVFSDHPRLMSAYALTWTFLENADTLSYFLAQECGIVDSTQPDELARTLAARTDKVSADASYLFE